MMVPVTGGVLELDLRVVHRHPRAHHRRAGIGEVEQGLLVLLLGDRLRLEQLVGPPLLAGGIGQLSLRHVEVRLGLRQQIARVPRVDADEGRAALDHLARLGEELQDLARGFGLHLDRGVGLDGARGLSGDDDVPLLDRDGAVDDLRGVFLAGPGEQHEAGQSHPERSEGSGRWCK